MKKILYLDTETTGTDVRENDVIQFAGIIEIGGKIKETFDFKIRPFNLEKIDDSALSLHGFTLEGIKVFPEPKDIYSRVLDLFGKYVDKYDPDDKFYPAGYNVGFDLDFLQQFFFKCNDKFGLGTWQNWKKIDPLPILHFMDSQGLISLANYKLSTVCSHFGISHKAHNALSDIQATKEVIGKVKEFFKKGEV